MFLANLNLTPTMQCNLKCKLCGVLVPHYNYRPQMTVDEADKTLKAVFEIVDKVGKLQITGGEPLMHPQLDQILQNCFVYSNNLKNFGFFPIVRFRYERMY